MKKIYSILCLFVAVAATVSCSDDDEIVLSTLNNISAFEINFEGLTTEDVTYDLGNSITISVPFNTSLTTLVPTIEIAEAATISPASGTAVDFVDGVAVPFTVTAEDGISVKTYNVTINVRGEVGSGSRIETYTLADLYGENSVSTYKYAESNFVNEITKEVNDWGDITTTIYTLVYDDKNQVIEVKSEAAELSTVYSYNEAGQIETGVYKVKGELTYTYTYAYDAEGNLTTETRTNHTDSDAVSVITFTTENGNVVKEDRYGEVYEAAFDDKNNPFKGIYPAAYSAINVGIQSVNVNNPISGTLADDVVTYEYNTDGYPISAAYTYFGGFATVDKTFTYYVE